LNSDEDKAVEEEEKGKKGNERKSEQKQTDSTIPGRALALPIQQAGGRRGGGVEGKRWGSIERRMGSVKARSGPALSSLLYLLTFLTLDSSTCIFAEHIARAVSGVQMAWRIVGVCQFGAAFLVFCHHSPAFLTEWLTPAPPQLDLL
jgi:hypothetical protein